MIFCVLEEILSFPFHCLVFAFFRIVCNPPAMIFSTEIFDSSDRQCIGTKQYIPSKLDAHSSITLENIIICTQPRSPLNVGAICIPRIASKLALSKCLKAFKRTLVFGNCTYNIYHTYLIKFVIIQTIHGF